MIHVCYAMTDKTGGYAKFVGTSIMSVLANTKSEVAIHILHDDTLNGKNRARLSSGWGRCIEFYNVSEKIADFINKSEEDYSRFSIATMYRLLIPDVLPDYVEKVIYLDADIIVNMDIGELYEENMVASGREMEIAVPFGGPIDGDDIPSLCKSGVLSKETYFNAGVLLLNLNLLRKKFPDFELLKSSIDFLVKYPTAEYHDQDALNFLFGGNYRALPTRYNKMPMIERSNGKNEIGNEIYHFTCNSITLNAENDEYSRMFFKYFVKTPWCDEEFIGRLAEGLRENLTAKLLSMTNLFLRKKRVFVGRSKDREKIRERFEIGADERYIIYEGNGALNLDVDLDSKDYVIVFFVTKYEAIKKFLKNIGCAEGEDFINGEEYVHIDTELDAAFRRYGSNGDYDIISGI